jgi:hypothetical protein
LVFQRFIFPNFSVNVQVYLLLLVSLRIWVACCTHCGWLVVTVVQVVFRSFWEQTSHKGHTWQKISSQIGIDSFVHVYICIPSRKTVVVLYNMNMFLIKIQRKFSKPTKQKSI